MTFPTVEGTTRVVQAGYDIDISGNWPGSRLADDIILLIFTEHVDRSGTISGDGTWSNILIQDTSGQVFNNSGNRLVLASWTRVTGGQAGSGTLTTTVTSSAGVRAGLHLYLIRGAYAAGTPASASGAASLSGGDANPPSHTPSWGADDTLWIACGSNDKGNPTSAPSGFSGLITDWANVGSGAQVWSAYQALNVASLDPGATSGGTGPGDDWSAMTISIRPATAAAGTGTRSQAVMIL